VWGDELRQQTRGTAGTLFSAPAEELVPLAAHQGTSVGAADHAGLATDAQESSAFGELSSTGPRLNHQFAGEYWDADAGLTYLRQRWYAPGIGRFVSSDPVSGMTTRPSSLNRYAYAANDPLWFVDPSGLFIGLVSISFDTVSSSYARASDAKRGYDTFNSIRNSLCKGIDAIGDATPDLHHLVPKYAGGKVKQDLMELDPGIHRSLHNLMQMAFVANGFPFANKGRKAVEKFLQANPGKADLRAKVILDVVGYMDDMCTGVRGYDKIQPKVDSILKIADIFDF
jgi:RHS repeat-associated protein